MEASQRSMHHTLRSPKEETDAQVAQIRNDPRPPSLCDVVTEELLAGRHPERPILSRIAIVGEVAHREEPVRNTIENLIGVVTKRVNSEDPSGGVVRTKVQQQQPSADGGPPAITSAVQTTMMSVSGVCVEFASHFIAVFESEPLHLVELVRETRNRLAKSSATTTVASPAGKAKSGSVDANSNAAAGGPSTAAGNSAAAAATTTAFSKVHIVYQVDDIVSRGTTLWTHIDATSLADSKAANNANNALFSAVPLDGQVVKAVYNMLSLGAHAQNLSSKAMREHFSTGAITTHAKQLPPQSFIEVCIKSDLCLSVAEYLQVFGKVPAVDRDKELLNPLEPPLHY